MFERYNEKARRTIFFARYQASQFGSPEIESEHFLLGLLRENKGTLSLTLDLKSSEQKIRSSIEAAVTRRPKTSIIADLPLTDECKRILGYAAGDAFWMDDRYIGPEHLLLGILRESECLAARILTAQGLRLETTRKLISESKAQLASPSGVAEFATQALSAFRGTEVSIVESETSDTLLTYRSRSSVPRIGESIFIRNGDASAQTYRIQDVIWEFEKTSNAAKLQAVTVRGVKETPIF